MTIDLHAIRHRHGGTVYDGGTRWIGPGSGHSRNDTSLSAWITPEGRLVVHSFAGDSFAASCAHLGLEAAEGRRQNPQEVRRDREARQRATALERARKTAFCAGVWGETLPAEGSPVEAYLRGRAITGPIPNAIRFHLAAPLGYDSRTTVPAMVAIVTGPDGKSVGLHVTALKPDGSGKADMTNPRRMFGDLRGATVRFSDVPPSGTLAVCEGIETGLAYRDLTGAVVWPCLSTSGLRNFTPPPEVKRLVVAADGDKGGREAADVLVERSARRSACAIASAPQGQDWNDVLKGAAS